MRHQQETSHDTSFDHRFANLGTSLLLLFILVAIASAARADSDDGIVRVKSAVPMAEAITRIKADIAGKGIKFFTEIDQSKLAADAGIKLRPSTLLVFGNPPLGTQFITSNPECRARLAGPPAADAGRQWRRLGGLDRFRMDRQAPQHQGPRRAVRDGDHGRRLDHLDDHDQVTPPTVHVRLQAALRRGLIASRLSARGKFDEHPKNSMS